MNTHIPWRLTTDFNEQKHLFYEKVKMDYEIESFACACGHLDFIIKDLRQAIKYVCPECENRNFHDANVVWKDIDHFLYEYDNLEFSCEYNIVKNSQGVGIYYITQIPKNIDFLCNKIIFAKKSIYGLEITIDGEIKKHYNVKYNNRIRVTLERKLAQYINRYQYFNLPYSLEKEMSLKQISFFLKNKHLKAFSFYAWKSVYELSHPNVGDIDINTALKRISNFRKEKSVRRSVYLNYRNQMEDNGAFASKPIAILTKTIKDPNILVKFLSLDMDLFEEYGDQLYSILVFLKQHYTERQIFTLFSKRSNDALLKDALGMLCYDEDTIALNFKRTKCNIKSIHDELTRCINAREYSEIPQYAFNYTKRDMKPCVILNYDYSVKLPKNNLELYQWGDSMHNCIVEYEKRIKLGKTILYGFFHAEELQFVVEICDGCIVEAKRKYNEQLHKEETKVLKAWFRKFVNPI